MRALPNKSERGTFGLGATVRRGSSGFIGFVLVVTLLNPASATNLQSPARSQVITDNCENVRVWFADARILFWAEVRQGLKRLDQGGELSRRQAQGLAEEQARNLLMDYMEIVAANAWPTTRDVTLRGILKNIADGQRVSLNTIALGRYCRAGKFIGL